MSTNFLSLDLKDIIVGEPLPGTIYVYLEFKFITFRSETEIIDRDTYDRLQNKNIKNLFILSEDSKKFKKWIEQYKEDISKHSEDPVNKKLEPLKEELREHTLSAFMSKHPDKVVRKAAKASEKLINEIMKTPSMIQNIIKLQTLSNDTVTHSINVGIISTYAALQMGYTHHVILQHIGMGGLLHDIGKTKILIEDSDSDSVVAQKMKIHPQLGFSILDTQSGISNEVKMIVEQHHEKHDGSGYPNGLIGSKIYDLSRIISIVNVFDSLVSKSSGKMIERQKKAIKIMDEEIYKIFDPKKLEKFIKIIKMGL